MHVCALAALGLAACAGAVVGVRGPGRTASGASAPEASHRPSGPPAAETARSLARSSATGTPRSASDLRLSLSADGTVGAWLVAGPFDRPLDAGSLRFPRAEARVTDAIDGRGWRLVAARDGVLDLGAGLDGSGPAPFATCAGVLHVARGGRHVLLLGVDDAVVVGIDGRPVFSAEAARPRRDDDDLVAVDLAPGDHVMTLSLHRLGRAWTLHARWLGPELRPVDDGWWALPGAGVDQAAALAGTLARVALDRGMGAGDYRPVLRVLLPAGTPLDFPLVARVHAVRAENSGSSDAGDGSAFEWSAGDVARAAQGRAEASFPLPELRAADVEDQDWNIDVEIGGRHVECPFHPRRAIREAVDRASRALANGRGATWLASGTLDTLEFLRDRIARLVARGDGDLEAQAADARELNELAAALEQGRDPYVSRRAPAPVPIGLSPSDVPAREAGADADDARTMNPVRSFRTGAMRRAYRSPLDQNLSEFALYVPPTFSPRKTYPLIVALHGMNGRPMQMLMWLFGHDDPNHDGPWEDRHPVRDLEPLEAIVVAPDGHENAMYRELGESDVMRVVDWAMQTYPIDASRVTITGPSMGGIGAAACALHHPDRFAAAAPLCGYHSYFVRGDIRGRTMRPWERFIAEQRSNVWWAENGQYLPLYIVHGTQDLPEENSGVLIDRYEELHYDVEHEHPDLGHNVWQTTYEDLKGAHWLLRHRRPTHPRAVEFKTSSTRWADNAWVHVRELSSADGWGEVSARIDRANVIYATTHGVNALAFDRDTTRIDDAAPVNLDLDGDALTFPAGEPIEAHRGVVGDGPPAPWQAGSPVHEGPFKHGAMTGPLRDVFHEPIVFVWGASDPAQARANEEVARRWARVRPGVRVDYPVMSDVEFIAAGETAADDHAIFLVGNARSNRVVRELEPSLPIRVEDDAVVVGARRFVSSDGGPDRSQLGAMFIAPNPRHPDRYVVIVEGLGPLGTWRSLSLPEMLPDFAVYDRGVAAAHGLLLLGSGTLRAAGFFGQDWSVPSEMEDHDRTLTPPPPSPLPADASNPIDPGSRMAVVAAGSGPPSTP